MVLPLASRPAPSRSLSTGSIVLKFLVDLKPNFLPSFPPNDLSSKTFVAESICKYRDIIFPTLQTLIHLVFRNDFCYCQLLFLSQQTRAQESTLLGTRTATHWLSIILGTQYETPLLQYIAQLYGALKTWRGRQYLNIKFMVFGDVYVIRPFVRRSLWETTPSTGQFHSARNGATTATRSPCAATQIPITAAEDTFSITIWH
jgi:hypothetical protein